MKVLIVGGVAGGATAAARLRRLDERMEIVIIERTGYISYANCGLPYYLGGVIEDREDLTLQTPQSFHQRFKIDARVNQEVMAIDPKNKRVRIKNLKTGEEYQEVYDKLILSPGAKAIKPDIPGLDRENVFSLRTVEDTFAIDDYLANHQVKKALIVGAGFIGLEMAENLHRRGIAVTVIQLLDQVLGQIDYDLATIVHNYLRKQGIDLKLATALKKVEGNERLTAVLSNQEELTGDMLVLAIGVQPESDLAIQAGIATGVKGTIRVNDRLETNVADIYAVGDAIEVINYVSQKPAMISLAGPANKQGRIIADNIVGLDSRYKGTQGSIIMKLFDMHIGATGLNESQIKELGIDYDYAITTAASHADYYPGAKSMFIKVLFKKDDGRILGGQIVGFAGVDKRIDVLATAIRAKMKASDLVELELSYAPPFSSAKDPINMIGYVIENIVANRVKQVHWDQVIKLPTDAIVLDTRTPGEYDSGHLAVAIHIPLDELRQRMAELPKNKRIYVHCQSGLRSYLACRILSQNGYDCYNVAGGYNIYQNIIKNEAMVKKGTGPCGL